MKEIRFYCPKCKQEVKVPIIWGKTIKQMMKQHKCKQSTNNKQKR